MKMKSILTALFVAFALSACSSVEKIVYRIDVPQGNYLEEANVKQLQVGMTKPQVQYLLGTPVLQDPFSTSTWYYVFLQQKGYESPEQHTLIVNFDQSGRVVNVELDKPLPDANNEVLNNVIIEAPSTGKASWWQFWK